MEAECDIDSGNESGSESIILDDINYTDKVSINCVSSIHKPKISAFKSLKGSENHILKPMCGEFPINSRTSSLPHMCNDGYDSEDELCTINGLVNEEVDNYSNLDNLPSFDSSPPTVGVCSTQLISPQKFFSKVNSYENSLHSTLNGGITKKSKYGKWKKRSFLNFEKMLRLCQASLSPESSQILLRTVQSGV